MCVILKLYLKFLKSGFSVIDLLPNANDLTPSTSQVRAKPPRFGNLSINDATTIRSCTFGGSMQLYVSMRGFIFL